MATISEELEYKIPNPPFSARASTTSPSDGDDVRWYFTKSPLRKLEVAASVPGSEIVARGQFLRFSMRDSLALEAAFKQREEELLRAWWTEYAECSDGPSPVSLPSSSADLEEDIPSSADNWLDPKTAGANETMGVPVKGGLYEVDLWKRRSFPVYWSGQDRRVLRGSWFARFGTHWLPLREDVAEQLEIAYRKQVWRRKFYEPSGLYAARVSLSGKASVRQPNLHALFTGEDNSWEAWLAGDASWHLWLSGTPGIPLRRGFLDPPDNAPYTKEDRLQQVEEELDDYCSQVPVAHVVFMVHGIGQRLEGACLVDQVTEFRRIFASLSEKFLTRYQRMQHRCLFIPCQWRRGLKLGGEAAVEDITLDGVRSLRTSVSATVHDVLYYMSPVYCQDIIDSVTTNLNFLFRRFKQRNPHFTGKVSIFGHSLGSVLLHDILCHQKPLPSLTAVSEETAEAVVTGAQHEAPNIMPEAAERVDDVTHSNDRQSNIEIDSVPLQDNEDDVSALQAQIAVLQDRLALYLKRKSQDMSSKDSDINKQKETICSENAEVMETEEAQSESAYRICDSSEEKAEFAGPTTVREIPGKLVLDSVEREKHEGTSWIECDSIGKDEADSVPSDIQERKEESEMSAQSLNNVETCSQENSPNDLHLESSERENSDAQASKEENSLPAPYHFSEDRTCNHSLSESDSVTREEQPSTSGNFTEGTSRRPRRQHAPRIEYATLSFEVDSFFAVGSPLGLFLTLRNIRLGTGNGPQQLEGIQEEMPACRNLLNIFHPYDPVAYRIEPLISREYVKLKPVFAPHHRSRRRLHIQLKEMEDQLIERVRKMFQRGKTMLGNLKTQCVSFFTRKIDHEKQAEVEEDQLLNLQLQDYEKTLMTRLTGSPDGRIDYMLQEATFDHPYIVAFKCHLTYWSDHDTALLIIQHLYRDTPRHHSGIEEDVGGNTNSSNGGGGGSAVDRVHRRVGFDLDDDDGVALTFQSGGKAAKALAEALQISRAADPLNVHRWGLSS